MNILNSIKHLPKFALLCTLQLQLEYRDWKFEKSVDNELYFILGNREIFTSKLSNEHLIDIILEVVFW